MKLIHCRFGMTDFRRNSLPKVVAAHQNNAVFEHVTFLHVCESTVGKQIVYATSPPVVTSVLSRGADTKIKR